MRNAEEIILEISLTLLVDEEVKTLEIPVPYNYDGDEILQLIMSDVMPIDPDSKDDLANSLELDDEFPLFELDDISGQMSSDDYNDWVLRAKDLQEIDYCWDILDETGLTPGEVPGVYDLRTGGPTVSDLDETLEHDLLNAAVVSNTNKAAFRSMRETSGASQALLADALGVNVRTVKRWETPGQPEPPRDAWDLVESWRNDAVSGAHWHVSQAEALRNEFKEAYTLTIYRNQEEFDRALAPILAQAPSYHWQDAFAEAQERAMAETGQDSYFEIDHPYTNFPGNRSYLRANAAAKLAAVLMEAKQIPYGFAFPGEANVGWGGLSVWVPRADVQRIETPDGTLVVCGMR